MHLGRVAPILWTAPSLLLFLLVGGCEPCAGVLTCGEPEIGYRGQLIERHTGRPLAGAVVEFVPAGGAPLSGSLSTRSDSLGEFEFIGAAEAPGQIPGRLRVVYGDGTVVDSIGMTLATAQPGDSRYLGRFPVNWPHFEALGTLYYRGTQEAASDVEVEFRRTGGAEVDPDTFVVRSDAFGNFPLRPSPTRALEEVVGELIIRPSAPLAPDTIRDVRFRPRLEPDPDPLVGRWGLGPILPFVGRAVWPDGSPAAGVEVEFQRVGGIQVEPARYVTTTLDWGGFHLGPLPLESGEVEFTLTFRPPAPHRSITYPYTLRTMEDETIVLIETWVLPR